MIPQPLFCTEEKRESTSQWHQVYIHGAIRSPKGETGRKVLYNYLSCHPIRMHPICCPLVGLQAASAALGHLLGCPWWQGSSGAVTAANASSSGAKGLPYMPAPSQGGPTHVHGRWSMLHGCKTALSWDCCSSFTGAGVLLPNKGDGEEGEGCAFQNRIYQNPEGCLLAPQHPAIPLLPLYVPLFAASQQLWLHTKPTCLRRTLIFTTKKVCSRKSPSTLKHHSSEPCCT